MRRKWLRFIAFSSVLRMRRRAQAERDNAKEGENDRERENAKEEEKGRERETRTNSTKKLVR